MCISDFQSQLVYLISDLVYVLNEKVPHHWLFQRCSAVIHHGGASTTSMGLRCGKPTMVCPFFGDQFFWAQEVVDAGVGVPPLSAVNFTIEQLCDRFVALRNKDVIAKVDKCVNENEYR